MGPTSRRTPRPLPRPRSADRPTPPSIRRPLPRSRANLQGTRRRSPVKLVKPYLELPRRRVATSPPRPSCDAPSSPMPRCEPMADEELSATLPPIAGPRSSRKARRPAPARSADEDFDSIIVEIRAGTGGDEAALFAGNLVRDVRLLRPDARAGPSTTISAQRGRGRAGSRTVVVHRQAAKGPTKHLRFESGGHRVQRVPARPRRRAASTPRCRHRRRPARARRGAGRHPRTEDIEWERHAGRRGGRAARQQDRVGRPHLVQARAPPTRSRSSARTSRSQHEEL